MIRKSILLAVISFIIAAPTTVNHTKAIAPEQTKHTQASSTDEPKPIDPPVVEQIETPPVEPMAQIEAVEIAPVEPIVAEPVQPVAPPEPVVVSGSADELMNIVGITGSERYYANCVIQGCEGVSPEGGWAGVTRWNTAGSGAYGICQALPAGKMSKFGDDYMTNAVTQLKWCNDYAVNGYGSWQKAFEFRKCLGSCYSPRTGGYVSKDHTWW